MFFKKFHSLGGFVAAALLSASYAFTMHVPHSATEAVLGPSPRNSPRKPSSRRSCLTTAAAEGAFAAVAAAPLAPPPPPPLLPLLPLPLPETWSLVFTTSSGVVSTAEVHPAASAEAV